jgi:type VI secretion system protein VasG
MALAEQMFGSAKKLTLINMSEFKESHKVSTLTGSPPGYVGYGEGGVLTEAVRRAPYSLVLLDEMEKAHASVQDIFYQMLDRGVMRDSEGRDIDFKQTVVVMTSNAADAYVVKHAEAIKEGSLEALQGLQAALEKHFKPAFLGRVQVVPFLPLNDATMGEIIHAQLDQLVARIKTHYHIALTYDALVPKQILSACTLAQTGARQIASVLDRQIAPILARTLLRQLGKGVKHKKLHLSYGAGGYALGLRA